MEQILAKLRALMPVLVQEFQVETLAIFGSYARHEQRQSSDLDLLVTFSVTSGLFKYIELENFISDHLGIKVDLVMKDALKPNMAQRILAEAVEV